VAEKLQSIFVRSLWLFTGVDQSLGDGGLDGSDWSTCVNTVQRRQDAASTDVQEDRRKCATHRRRFSQVDRAVAFFFRYFQLAAFLVASLHMLVTVHMYDYLSTL